jgi:hypothetical protein
MVAWNCSAEGGAGSEAGARRICTTTDSRIWYEALTATPDPLPDELADAVVTNLKIAEEDHHALNT